MRQGGSGQPVARRLREKVRRLSDRFVRALHGPERSDSILGGGNFGGGHPSGEPEEGSGTQVPGSDDGEWGAD